MTERPIIFVDANTIWHRRLAEALGEARRTIALLPQQGLMPDRPRTDGDGPGLTIVSQRLLPGWASKTAAIGQRQIAAAVHKVARGLKPEPVIVLTSPKYRLLSRILEGRYPLVYYCADDYREYAGWGGMKMAEAEADIIERTDLAVFVSDALGARAISEYGVKEAATLTSPNATEPRFLANGAKNLPGCLANAARPIFGVLGGLNQRLELGLMQAIADLDAVGTLVVIGPVDAATREIAPGLCQHPNVVITGQLPHWQMHIYARALDVALIPYTRAPINHFCSPMRLYDHLASGIPIFATDACDQVNQYGDPSIVVADTASLPAKLADFCATRFSQPPTQTADLGALLWSRRAERLFAAMETI